MVKLGLCWDNGKENRNYYLGYRVEGLRSDMGVPQTRDTILGGGPRKRIIIFGGLYWGPLILGNYHVCVSSEFTVKGLPTLQL